MKLFTYQRASTAAEAIAAGGTFLAGGSSLIDLLKLEVLNADRVVDVNRLPLRSIEADSRAIKLGALASNTAVAEHALVKEHLPALSQAILSGASPQLRNVATIGGNLLQRTRCAYYRDLHMRCNKRVPGEGCDALEGWTRMHAVLGTSDSCIAAHPSDMCVAMVALDAVIHLVGPDGERDIPIAQLHLLPGDHPEREFALQPGELITQVQIPTSSLARRSRYVKARDRQAYAFALASCAGAVETTAGRISAARIALGGVATKPWRAEAAEQSLVNALPSREAFQKAAAIALDGARPRGENAFKIELAKRYVVRALLISAELA